MNQTDKYYIRDATPNDITEIFEGMKNVYETLENKDFFVLDSLDFIEKQICEEGFAVVACNEPGKIIASLIIRYPKEAPDNLGYDMGLEQGELNQVAHIETVVVAREYRGNGIQGQLLDYAEKAIDSSTYHFLMATVAPDNHASKRTFLHHEYEVLMTKEKYGGLQRDIMFKRLR